MSVGFAAALGAGIVAILRLDRAIEAELRMTRDEQWTGAI